MLAATAVDGKRYYLEIAALGSPNDLRKNMHMTSRQMRT